MANLIKYALFSLSTLAVQYQYAQEIVFDYSDSHIYTKKQLELLMEKPACLDGYCPNQSGYLSKFDSSGNEQIVTTFTLEQMKIPSEGIKINGWLYLPLGNKKHPLIVLTNSGGGNSPYIRSFSDWIAPILAHCGIAAFVHDKRGTGKSEGNFAETTYDDYIADAGNCAVYLSKHKRIDRKKIGITGGSEGGRIAVLAANRYPEIDFVISFTGSVTSTIDDRIYAQKGWLKSFNLPDSAFLEVMRLHEKSIRAWASNNPDDHFKVNIEIQEMRKKYDKEVLPSTQEEMYVNPEFIDILPTWNSLSNDYLTELGQFNKAWLAIFGELDQVIPTQASVKNIRYYMSQSGNNDYNIAIIPDCGHAPVNIKTKRLIRLDNIIINWLNKNIN